MRVYTYIFIVIGIQMLLYLAGISLASGYVLGTLNPFSPENFQTGGFYLKIIGILTLTIAGGVVLGYYFRVNPESYIVGGLAGTVLILFVGDLISIIVNYKANNPQFLWMAYLIDLVLFPVAVTFALSLISWWRGASD